MMCIEELIGAKLRERRLCMGTAESCTGGSIANRITSVAGSSDYFTGGIVSYCNRVKHQLLGVSECDLQHFGAVSRQVVEQMARGAIKALSCDCAVATSGIAGPGGGSAEKPVGTVWIAAAVQDRLLSECCHFQGSRSEVIEQSASTALRMLLDLLESDGREQ